LRRRVRRNGKLSAETVHLISSLPPEALPAERLQKAKRDYWSIESALHYRLDEVLLEDKSRVRTPKSAHVLGMFRRLALSMAIPWIEKRKRTRRRTSTRDFQDHLSASNAKLAHTLVTAAIPAAWFP
jgi:hypothetical protein